MTKNPSDKKYTRELYHKLTEGNVEASLQIYEKYSQSFEATDFVDKILKPTLTEIEDDFESKKISVAERHVAKNVAVALVRIISDKQNKND